MADGGGRKPEAGSRKPYPNSSLCNPLSVFRNLFSIICYLVQFPSSFGGILTAGSNLQFPISLGGIPIARAGLFRNLNHNIVLLANEDAETSSA